MLQNKQTAFRFDDETLEKLQDILRAKALEYGKDVAYGLWSPRHNSINRTEVMKLLIREEWDRINESGSLGRALNKKCRYCGKTGHDGGLMCEG
jgi:hypothetical protein